MSEKNSKIIFDFCHYHGVHENKIFSSRKVRDRFKSLNTKARKIALQKMITDLVRWNIPKCVQLTQKHTNFKLNPYGA